MGIRIKIALLGAAVLVAAPALAQPAPPPSGGPAGGRGPAAMFERMDGNRDGRVGWDEAWGFVQERFTEADRDRDGGLTQDEIRTAMPRRGGADASPPPEAGRRAEWGGRIFRGLDADRDGRVTLTELRPAAEARFRAMDVNGDSAVSRDELPQRRGGRHGGPRGEAPAAR